MVNYTIKSQALTTKIEDLENFISTFQSAIIAYSGGIDSSLVANISNKVLGKDKTLVIIAVSPSLNNTEYDQALNLARKYDWNFKPIFTKEFNNENNITPKSITTKVKDIMEGARVIKGSTKKKKEDIEKDTGYSRGYK